MPDWKKVKVRYIRDNVSYRRLAEEFGVSLSSIARKAKSENWADLRRQAEHKATTKIVESVASREASKSEKIQTVADVLLDRIVQGVNDGVFSSDSQSIRQITLSLKDLMDIKGIKSELDAQEQLARIEKLRREAQAESSDKEIRVVLDDAVKDYAR